MGLKAAELFDAMVPHLENKGAEVVKKVGAVFHFEVREKKTDEPTVWTVNLKTGKGMLVEHQTNLSIVIGSIEKGKIGKADSTFVLLDKDMMDIANGKLDPQVAFMQGKMKIKGNLGKASKFTPDLLPKKPKL